MKKRSRNNRRKVSTLFLGSEKDYFAENLSMLLAAGIGVSAAITIMIEGSSNHAYKKVLKVISLDLDDGNSLWKTLEGRGIFNHSYIYMTKVGEASGRLSENLTIIAEQEKKRKSFQSKLTSALIYPGIILSMTLIIGLAVIWFVIPKMAKIFSDMKIDLPLPTQIMINLGNFISNNPITFFSIIFGLVISVIFIFFIPGTKKIGQLILFRIPRIRNLYKEIEVARFGYVMFSLTQAGIPLTEALSSIERSTELSQYKKFYKYLSKSVNEGNSLEKSFHNYKNLKSIIPINMQQMIIAGERSGNLVSVLGKISGIYEEKIDVTSKNIAVILEPLLLFVVALGVLFLALAVVMPIYGLVGGLDATQ